MTYAKILGTGSYLPEKVLTNADLEKMVDTTDEWILKRVGIRQRHVCGENDTTATMGLEAAKNALDAAGLDAQDLDMIIVGTATSAMQFPSTACIIQGELGIKKNIPAFDINAACSGFIYGLSMADQFIKTGSVQNVLVIGTEALTRVVDWTDRSTCVLFGDGAGAVVMQSSEDEGIVSTSLYSDGAHRDLLWADNHMWKDDPKTTVQMKGNEVFRVAVNKLSSMIDDSLAATDYAPTDVDWLIPHQANLRIISAAAKRLGLSDERVVVTVGEHGNTSAASIPLALDHAVRSGQVKRGELLFLEAFGAGFAWGSALVRY